jgi:hypothetical protein
MTTLAKEFRSELLLCVPTAALPETLKHLVAKPEGMEVLLQFIATARKVAEEFDHLEMVAAQRLY